MARQEATRVGSDVSADGHRSAGTDS